MESPSGHQGPAVTPALVQLTDIRGPQLTDIPASTRPFSVVRLVTAMSRPPCRASLRDGFASLGPAATSLGSVRSPDPDDDYLLAPAISARSYLVTGDQHLLGLEADLPILTPAEFLTKLRQGR